MRSSELYGLRASGEAHGDVFTRPEVVRYMLDLVGYVAERDLSQTSILEPSCGSGEFVEEILRRLRISADTFGFDANQTASQKVIAYEIDDAKCAHTKRRIESLSFSCADQIVRNEDFLKAEIPYVDIVVGNPPYIRYEQLSAETISFCKTQFPTFHYRADLYIPFYEKTLRRLNQGGKHCFICSNRWLKNEYGRKLRRLIASDYCLDSIIDMEQADPFLEDVLAYTDIVLLSRRNMASVYSFAKLPDISELQHVEATSYPCPTSEDWTLSFLPKGCRNNLFTIDELGLKIGIGVATGADKIFISKNLPSQIEEDLLLPIINAHDLRNNEFRWSGAYLLNPYQPDGSLVPLDLYPKLREYLSLHEEALRKRHVASRDQNRWYRTIDRITHSLLNQPKILLPDLTANTKIFVDEGRFYPAHNIYYITGAKVEVLQLLSAVLMSDFIAQQLSVITNKMNGGFKRWQSQFLHKLLVPDVTRLPEQLSSELLHAYAADDLEWINLIVNQIVEAEQQIARRQKCVQEYAQPTLHFC